MGDDNWDQVRSTLVIKAGNTAPYGDSDGSPNDSMNNVITNPSFIEALIEAICAAYKTRILKYICACCGQSLSTVPRLGALKLYRKLC